MREDVSEMKNFELETLKIQVESNNGTLLLAFIGVSDHRDPSPLLKKYFEEVLAESSATIELDFCKLEFMNSSTTTALLFIIKKLEEKARQATIIFDIHSAWQKIAFSAIEAVTANSQYVQVRGK
jgi:anti-anti-sigma regulatory factor